MLPPPKIITDRLVIRAVQKKDAAPIYQYRSHPDVCRFQPWRPQSASEVEAFIDSSFLIPWDMPNTRHQLAICLKDGALIGDLGIHFLDDYQVEIGYTLSPDFQGLGYATEAVRVLVDYFFKTMKKHRVTASVEPDNARSVKLLERLGFRKEAHFVKSFRMDDRWTDDCIYAMLSEDWQ